ncbi:hypothetical protein A9K58_06000 [Stenotrophomonas maltophilia]|uniref:Uncharacterized protein n=1 Tax=Stenotrophomonas maltophilia TaxID=40324 RepID=A0A1A6Y074_STEMA|nr:hypothetical protein A9K58_06000 [Stenotrophomonas maltophilia]
MPEQGPRVGRPIDESHGAAVPASLDVRIASLMSRFSQLTPVGQKRFMELLNAYLYASPSQRRQLRRNWQAISSDDIGDLDLAGEDSVKKSN